MNIKAELNKPMKFFKEITLSTILLSILFSIILATLSIGFGQAIFLKLGFIVIASVFTLLLAFDDKSKSDDEQHLYARQGAVMIIMTLLFAEIPLAIKANSVYSTPINVVVMDKVRTETSDGNVTKTTPYKQIDIINLDNNERLGYRNFFEEDQKLLDNWTTITSKEHYYDYFPFFVFSEEFRYIRKDK